MGLAPRKAGEFIFPDYQIHEDGIIEHDYSAEPEHNWISEFWNNFGSKERLILPRPVIAKTRVKKSSELKSFAGLTGGLIPYGEKYLTEDYQWVCSLNMNYYLCRDTYITAPNDKQFNKYFRRHFENHVFSLVERYNHQLESNIIRVEYRDDKKERVDKESY